MAGTIGSNMSTAAGQVNQQKNSPTREPSQGKGNALSNEQGSSGKPSNDTVTLRHTVKQVGQVRELDAQEAQKVLPETKAAIVSNSKTALATQAKFSAQAAKEMLADH